MSSKFRFAGIEIDNLTIDEVLDRIKELVEKNKKSYIVAPNAAHIVLLQKDKEFKKAYEKAEMVLADGMSILFASYLLGVPLRAKCSGADLFPKICELLYNMNKKIFILGGVNGSEKIAEEKLKKMYPGIKVKTYSPPIGFENDEYETKRIIEMINDFSTDFLFLCTGAPKSEKWIYKNINRLNIKVAFHVGMALNFFAGVKKRAPRLIQKIGLEWFWRLVQEPKRLWRRYLIGNMVFIWLILKEFINRKIIRFNKL